MSRLFTLLEVCEVLRVTPNTVRRWARSGRLPSVRLGRKILFKEKALETAIAQAEQPAGELAGA